MGICNYCHMQQIQNTAKKAGLVVKTKPQDGGVRVLVHGKKLEPKVVAWFAKLPSRCVC